MKPTKTLFVTAALILGAMGAQAADFVQNGNYLTVQLKQHQNYGPSQIRLQVVNDRIIVCRLRRSRASATSRVLSSCLRRARQITR